ncbi:MAG TPA: hydrogenase [Candidatus Omnitrophica bacterium]|nr:hydrogenase [Candidatus Omnitrophota bacterium]
MWLESALILIILFGIIILGNNRLSTMIQLLALQSLVLSITPLLIHPSIHAFTMTIVTIVLKVIVMPSLLFWAIRHVSIRREVQPLIGYGKTLLLGGFLMGVAFLISSKLDLPDKGMSNLLVPTAFSLVMIGFLLLVTRFKAITQVIGYLVMENGIFLFALLLLEKTPLLVEMGIFLDIFVGVLVMGIIINHINQEFGSASTVNLTNLRD